MLAQLNVSIDSEVYKQAKSAAKDEGVFLRKWIERAIQRACPSPEKPYRERPDVHFGESIEDNVRRIVPIEDL